MQNLEGANCATTDPEIFFPERGSSRGVLKVARAICRACEVFDECREDAVQNTERFGIQAGLSPRERERLRSGRDTH